MQALPSVSPDGLLGAPCWSSNLIHIAVLSGSLELCCKPLQSLHSGRFHACQTVRWVRAGDTAEFCCQLKVWPGLIGPLLCQLLCADPGEHFSDGLIFPWEKPFSFILSLGFQYANEFAQGGASMGGIFSIVLHSTKSPFFPPMLSSIVYPRWGCPGLIL